MKLFYNYVVNILTLILLSIPYPNSKFGMN